MRLSLIVPLLALAAIAVCAQQAMPRMTNVEPDNGKAGDILTVSGEHLDKGVIVKGRTVFPFPAATIMVTASTINTAISREPRAVPALALSPMPRYPRNRIRRQVPQKQEAQTHWKPGTRPPVRSAATWKLVINATAGHQAADAIAYFVGAGRLIA